MIDVLIAGGGPAGLATAICCARAGLSVTVAEPRAAPVDKACGEGLMPAAVARLAAIGVRPGGHPLGGIRYVSSRHADSERADSGHADSRHADSRHADSGYADSGYGDSGYGADAPFHGDGGLGVRRTALHAALSARAAGLGIPVVPQRVTGFRQCDGHVIARCGTGGGGDRAADNFDARYLVAADGLHSPVRRACGLDPTASRHRRFGLRRHYAVAPWTDRVEVHWAADSEAYVTPLAEDLIGVAILGSDRTGGFESRLAAFPALRERLAAAVTASDVRGAGPLRQDVRRRVTGRVLLVGDAAGYLDALTGEGIGAALAQADALAACLAKDRPDDYELAWRRVTRKSRVLTSGLLWARHQPFLARRIVPAAQRLPWLFTAIVNQVGAA
ncbi:MAG TPA: NAD(P)/FAD-dependent oxidoreductase [Trebonia sp.]|nr:NAD(P)/FAD-dependent oxidoreductase [Trebonia sp.]